MQPRAANQTGHLAVLGRMADQAGGLVDDQQIGVLEDDVEHGKLTTDDADDTDFSGCRKKRLTRGGESAYGRG